MKKTAFLLLALLVLSCSPKAGGEGADAGKKFSAWPAPAEVRTYHGAFSRNPEQRLIKLEGLAGEVLSAQVVVKCNRDIEGLSGKLSDLSGPSGAIIPAAAARVRYAGFIPVDETMELTADPLLEESSVAVSANQAQPVWLTLKVPRDAAAGVYEGKFEVSAASGDRAEFELSLEVLPAVLPEPWDFSFYLTLWQDPSGVARAHKVKVWSEEHWKLLERYAGTFGAHGMHAITTSIIYDPWKSQCGYPFDNMVEWKFPGEYKPGAADKLTWDFTVFDRYVQLMLDAGVRKTIHCFAMVMGPGRTTDANIRYLDTAGGGYRTAEMTAGSPEWKEVWKAFLPVLRAHLKDKGWFDKTVLGFDEKPQKVMQEVFDFVIENAPDFKVSLAGGFPGDERKWGDEVILHLDEVTNEHEWEQYEPLVKSMHADPKRFISFYTACEPYSPNNELYSPLRESRLMPWIACKYGFDGYLRWSVNAFPENVWSQPNYNWHSGDMFLVYPGQEGPLDGLRFELLRQGIQDYEAIKIARELAEKAGRQDLLKKLDEAVWQGATIDSCEWIPYIEEARALVNAVIRELGPGA